MAIKRTTSLRPIESLKTRDENDNPIIEGYFAVFGREYAEAPKKIEQIEKGAFARSIAENDIRALVNHDSTLVLGRNKSNTLELREDDTGLFGRIYINPNDVDAMNLHSRVERGDVSQASFGFFIREKKTEMLEDGTIKWTILDADLLEVSPCTFPAYPDTALAARTEHDESVELIAAESWREVMLRKFEKLEG